MSVRSSISQKSSPENGENLPNMLNGKNIEKENIRGQNRENCDNGNLNIKVSKRILVPKDDRSQNGNYYDDDFDVD